jgi:alpha/beta superfamily hydrolase
MVAGPLGQYRQLRQTLAPSLVGVAPGPPHEGDTGQGVVLHTTLGPIKAMLHQSATGGARALLWAWGARGGYAGPAEGVFAQLAEAFPAQGLTSLRRHYRHPGVYVESGLDVRAGLECLQGRDCARVVLVGHSFGGAVVIASGTLTDQGIAVVALSPQTYGAQGAVYVAPRPLLLVHGLADTRLPPSCARQIDQWADEPKELVFYPGAEHGLRECMGELHALLRRWIPEKLGDDCTVARLWSSQVHTTPCFNGRKSSELSPHLHFQNTINRKSTRPGWKTTEASESAEGPDKSRARRVPGGGWPWAIRA